MMSPTKTFDQSPAEWVGAAVLIAYGIVAGLVGPAFCAAAIPPDHP